MEDKSIERRDKKDKDKKVENLYKICFFVCLRKEIREKRKKDCF